MENILKKIEERKIAAAQTNSILSPGVSPERSIRRDTVVGINIFDRRKGDAVSRCTKQNCILMVNHAEF